MSRPLTLADLPEEVARFAETQISAGRFVSIEAFLLEGVKALLERDAQKRAELRAAIDEGEASGVATGDPFARVRQQLGIAVR